MSKAYQVVREFEKEIARWCGADYGVSVSSCCNAIFLCLKYLNNHARITLPHKTYPGVAMAVVNAGYRLRFKKRNWRDYYVLEPFNIVDSALTLKRDMYKPPYFWCLSFHHKKLLPIGRGGMILTNDEKAVAWLKMARYDGRQEKPMCDDNATICGWNMYLTPEQATRGLALFETIKDKNLKSLNPKDQCYPDLRTWRCFK